MDDEEYNLPYYGNLIEQRKCKQCKGVGVTPKYKTTYTNCKYCDGKGTWKEDKRGGLSAIIPRKKKECIACHGTGKLIASTDYKKCWRCEGKGWYEFYLTNRPTRGDSHEDRYDGRGQRHTGIYDPIEKHYALIIKGF